MTEVRKILVMQIMLLNLAAAEPALSQAEECNVLGLAITTVLEICVLFCSCVLLPFLLSPPPVHVAVAQLLLKSVWKCCNINESSEINISCTFAPLVFSYIYSC